MGKRDPFLVSKNWKIKISLEWQPQPGSQNDSKWIIKRYNIFETYLLNGRIVRRIDKGLARRPLVRFRRAYRLQKKAISPEQHAKKIDPKLGIVWLQIGHGWHLLCLHKVGPQQQRNHLSLWSHSRVPPFETTRVVLQFDWRCHPHPKITVPDTYQPQQKPHQRRQMPLLAVSDI